MKRAQIEKEITDAFVMFQRGYSREAQIQLLANQIEKWIAEAKLPPVKNIENDTKK